MVDIACKAIVQAYDFARFERIVDVGGGYGLFIAELLRAAANTRGVIFDLPYVAVGARERISAAGIADRCDVVSGDFFSDALPPGADAYILKNMVESFDMERTTKLLQRCRQAMSPQGKLLVIGWIMRRGKDFSFGDLLDPHFLVALGGRVRTEDEYGTLFKSTGFRISRIISTGSPMAESILECEPE